ncbi:MAG TPA: cation transporter [Candidatus Acetothermia bacterium]|nr:cation transporter [Candidatus Acetothermia bacterium]
MNPHSKRALACMDSGVRVTLIGLLINIALVFAKLFVGMLTGSIALIADGIHSGSDITTDLVVIGGIRLAGRPADSSHPYGHGRYETLAGGAVAGALILVGMYITWNAGSALYADRMTYPGIFVIIVAIASILSKEWVYRRTIRVARRLQSTALHANAWHHRSDALSSVAVLFGGIAGLMGWGHADQIAGIVVGMMVVAVGAKTVRNVLHELLEGSVSTAEIGSIREAIEGISEVRSFHKLRARSVGREAFIDLHVLVDPQLSLLRAHEISMRVEDEVRSVCDRPVNVTVHIEPDTPELADHNKA